MRRLSLALVAVLALVLAGCGGEETVSPVAETVQGTLPKAESPGKAVFAAQGCGSCHTYAPAGSTAKVGPDLDKLGDYAKEANQPVEQFTEKSIVDPNSYVQSGFPKGVMPDYSKLSDDDVAALVDYLTQPQS
jgi:cytochrome c oxidase subunit 2